MPRGSSSIAAEEIDRFSHYAEDWWNPDGAFRPLHRLNPVRLEYVRDQACAHFGRAPSRHCLKGLKILDVGCGGGLLAEPLARLGAGVTGIDASEETIAVAKQHAKTMRLDIDYLVASVEDLLSSSRKTFSSSGVAQRSRTKESLSGTQLRYRQDRSRGKRNWVPDQFSFASGEKKIVRDDARFDLITALEVIEHVADVDSFLASLAGLLKPGGLLILSTLNRTPKSFLLGIVAAEYVLGWIPRGTHDWKKFVRPSELVERLEKRGLRAGDLTGMIFNPLRGEFELRKDDLEVNYLVTAKPLSRVAGEAG